MPSGPLKDVLRQIHKLVEPRPSDGPTDGQLLGRFVTQREEAAFEGLVRRHGPMVHGVCRRMLKDPHDVDDAFQATFLVLLRKAGSITNGEAVGRWLYRVAYHAALRVRAGAARRREQERQVEAMPAFEPANETIGDLQPILDELVNGLPKKYREPLVLCYLQGKTAEEAAQQLGCPVGTLWAWLSRGRERLRQKLTRRGLVVPAAALAAVLEQYAASAAVPARLLDATVEAGRLWLAGEAAGAFAPAVATVAQGVVRGMFLSKLRSASLVMLLLAVVTGSGWLTLQAGAVDPAPVPEQRPFEAPAIVQPATDERAQFAKRHGMLKPQVGESRWREIPWLTSIGAARQKAAAAGKPILLNVTGGGNPLGPCGATGRLSRSPEFWTDANVLLIKENFVAVAVDRDIIMTRQDAEGWFVRDTCGLEFHAASQSFTSVTAAGKKLEGSPRRAWEAFNQLPEAERRPEPVAVAEFGPLDPAVAPPDPPAGGLILKVYARPLARNAAGELRHAVASDFPALPPDSPMTRAMFEAAPDHMWLTAEEWRALVPVNPRPGDKLPVATALAHRLCRFHLVPQRTYMHNGAWPARAIRNANLHLTVEEAGTLNLRLRLEGVAVLGDVYDPTLALEQHGQGYEARLYGLLNYDSTQKVFTRFDVTAVGEVYGKLVTGMGAFSAASRPGRQPVGFAFELVRGDAPADRIPPTGCWNQDTRDYFTIGKQ